ncbi:MAG: 2Fe-2S iron-sulfur cluster-binding protein [Gammaproteobacteria bacterium]
MPRIIFHCLDGEQREVDATVGNTVMETAIDANIDGIVAECGGACACATCHSYVAEDWVDKVSAMTDMEDAMLDAALDRDDRSRLTCQIEVSEELDGLVIVVADNEG